MSYGWLPTWKEAAEIFTSGGVWMFFGWLFDKPPTLALALCAGALGLACFVIVEIRKAPAQAHGNDDRTGQ